MNIIVAGRRLAVTEALRRRVVEKVEKLARHFETVHKVQAWLRVEPHPGRNQVAEITLWADGLVVRGEEASEDLYTSIDLAVEKLERQVGKFRSRVIDRRRALAGRRKVEEARETGEAAPQEPLPSLDLRRRKRFELKPMSPEDAALQMELLGHTFFVFRNAETLAVNVVYRRNDGSYGLIEPDQ